MYYIAPIASTFSKVKPDVSQSEVKFHDDFGFCDSISQDRLSQIFDVIHSDVARRLFCFGSLVILDVARCYLWLFTLYINIKISKNSC